MPFRRKYTYRRKRYNRKYKRKSIATKKYVRSYINKQSEKKYFDISRSTDTIDYSGRLDRLTGISQGTTDLTRVGDKIRLTSMRVSYSAELADTTNYIRFIIFQWYPTSNLLAPTVNYILSLPGSILSPQSPFVHDYKNQYTILYDKTHVLTQDYPNIIRKFWLRMKFVKKQIAFEAGTQEGSNHLYLLRISDSSAASHPTSNILTRVNYTDS